MSQITGTNRLARYERAKEQLTAAYERWQSATTDGAWIQARAEAVLWTHVLQLIKLEGQPVRASLPEVMQ
jgi:hypothetical protein